MIKIAVFALALALAGCAQTRQAAEWLSSDKAQKAAANLKSLATAIDCGLVVSGAALSKDIARVVDAGQAAIDRVGKVYAMSSAVCEGAGRVAGALILAALRKFYVRRPFTRRSSHGKQSGDMRFFRLPLMALTLALAVAAAGGVAAEEVNRPVPERACYNAPETHEKIQANSLADPFAPVARAWRPRNMRNPLRSSSAATATSMSTRSTFCAVTVG